MFNKVACLITENLAESDPKISTLRKEEIKIP